MSQYGPELPLNSNAVILGEKAKPNRKQIKDIDNRDDRLEICTLLKHLSPDSRLAFFRWVCANSILPGTFGLHPAVGPTTIRLTQEARHCDEANGMLTMDIIGSLSHLWVDWGHVQVKACLEELVRRVRGKS